MCNNTEYYNMLYLAGRECSVTECRMTLAPAGPENTLAGILFYITTGSACQPGVDLLAPKHKRYTILVVTFWIGTTFWLQN